MSSPAVSDEESSGLLHHPREREASPIKLAIYSTSSYLCFYGLRKPWVVLLYNDVPPIFGASPKVAIAASQMIFYFLGKTFGVKIVAGVPQNKLHRALAISGIVAAAAWIGFALFPYGPLTLVAAALGGFPLALTWSLIYRYVEGRRCSDAVGGVMGCSIVVGPGLAKLVCAAAARWCTSIGIGEWDAPLLTACIFLPLLLISLHGLDRTPPPTQSERAELGDRAVRIGGVSSVGGASSLGPILREHWPGILAVGLFNALTLGARELRDVFQPELWVALFGHTPSPHTFLLTELPAALLLLMLLPFLSTVRQPARALLLMHLLMLGSGLCLPLLSGLRASRAISGEVWFSLLGGAIFVGTVTVTACFSDRLVSALKLAGSSAALIQLIDAFGYAGSLLTLAIVEYSDPKPGRLLPTAEGFFIFMGPTSVLCALASGVYWFHGIARR